MLDPFLRHHIGFDRARSHEKILDHMEAQYLALQIWLSALLPGTQAAMTVSSFDGAVTTQELQPFFVHDHTAASTKQHWNNWVQGKSGVETKAIGLI
jgi:hypothetical protein